MIHMDAGAEVFCLSHKYNHAEMVSLSRGSHLVYKKAKAWGTEFLHAAKDKCIPESFSCTPGATRQYKQGVTDSATLGAGEVPNTKRRGLRIV